MPGTFSFADSFDNADIVPQTDFHKGAGTGINDSTALSVQGADYHFHNNDVSVVGVALFAGQTISLDVDNGVGGIKSFNSELWVVDTSGALQASNNNAGTTDNGSTSSLDPYLDFTAQTTGVYFVAVSQKDNHYVDGTFGFDNKGSGSGDFLLNMSFSNLPGLHHGTAGNDSLTLNTHDHLFEAGSGNDTITAADINSRIDGGSGDDYISGSYIHPHHDILTGGSGDDGLYGNGGADVLAGNSGNDYLDGGLGNDQLFGGTQDDTLSGNGGADFLAGGTGNDYLYGNDGADTLRGGHGRDNLTGGAGKDLLIGGPGEDTGDYYQATAGVTVDLRNSHYQNTHGAGYDKLVGIEDLQGSSHDDLLIGNAGSNYLVGEDGNDTLRGQGGNDTLDDNGGGNDQLFGGGGNDNLYGDAGADHLHGGAGSDYMRGGDGNDTLLGGGGNDYLFGGAGADHLKGGPGSDQFVFTAASDSAPGAADHIVDFSHADGDQIDLYDAYSGTLTFINAGSFTGTPGEVRVHALNSGDQAVDVNLDNNPNTVEMHIIVHSATTLVAGDFIL